MKLRLGPWLFGMTVAAVATGLVVPAAAQVPPDRPVLVVGHRGASKLAPEHTGAAYDRAVRAGVDVLECDLQLTKDEQLVCVHDETVDRTTGGAHKGRVDSYTLAQLRAMDFGSWFGPAFAGAKIMTLEEQLTCYRGIDPTLQFYIETKAPATYGGRMEPLLTRLLQRLDLIPSGEPDVRTSPIIMQSFDNASLVAMRKQAPSLPTALLTSVGQPAIPANGEQPEAYAAIAPSWEAQPALIKQAHDAGREVHTWTVDDPAQIKRLIDLGIDGFFTNDPAAGRTAVDAGGRGSGRKAYPAAADDAARAPGCPEGAGVGFTRAADVSTSTPATATDATAQAAPAQDLAEDSGDDGFPIALVAIAAVLAAVVVTIVVVRRRRPSASA